MSNRVYRSLNKPLTLLGVERKLFFFLLTISLAVFNAFGGLISAAALFALLYALARLGDEFDPRILCLLMNSHRFAVRYDAAKYKPTEVVKEDLKDEL